MIVNSENKTVAPATSNEQRTLRSVIDAFVEHHGHTALLSFTKNGSSTLSYIGLMDEVKGVAAGLMERGLQAGNTVVIFASNSPSWVICCLAVMYAGAVAVPVDPQHSDQILAHIVGDSRAQWIFTDEMGAKKVQEAMPGKNFNLVLLDDEESKRSWKKLLVVNPRFNDEHGKSKLPAAKADDIVVTFYTSGTTGMPKGVPLSHANILMQVDSVLVKLDLLKPTDRVLMPLPFFHVYPLNVGLLGPLRMGLPVILPMALTGPELMRALHEGGATVFVGVPRLLRSLVSAIDAKINANPAAGHLFDFTVRACSFFDRYLYIQPGKLLFGMIRRRFAKTLRLFTSGGAPLDPIIAAKIRALGWDLAVGYGLTETAPLLTIRLPDNHDIESVGAPIPGVQIKIARPEKLGDGDDNASHGQGKEKDARESNGAQSSGSKDEGEILTKGPNVFHGYLHLDEKTDEVFTSDGWFKTGDLGVMHNGNLRITGRASSTLVMEGGKKIHPDEIEDSIAKRPTIREIALLQHEHKLVAIVVPELKQTSLDNVEQAVGAALKAAGTGAASYLHITDFAITRQPLPRTNLGKLKRHELPDIYARAKAKTKTQSANGQGVEISSEDRALLADPTGLACWNWLKERFAGRTITMDTSPAMELNIDSLEWMNLSLELLDTTGVQLTEGSIGRIETVRDLLNEVVTTGRNGGGDAISPLDEPERFLNDEQSKFIRPLAPWQSDLARFLYGFNRILMKPFEVEVHGLDELPPNEPFIFTPNHASYIDAFSVASALPMERIENTSWAGWVGIAYGNPIFSFLSRIAQVIPIDAKGALITSLALAAAVLKHKRSLVWFPEAKRTLTGDLLPFKQGIGVLLAKTDVRVVPMYLDGTRRALPPGAFFPRPTKIRVFFGKPVSSKQLEKEGLGENAQERIANALHDRVRKLQYNRRRDPRDDAVHRP
jgi:long-chain acyl-CoA synthetase